MRKIVLVLGSLFLIIFLSECRKKPSCIVVTITDSAPGCGGWGIVVNGTKYTSSNIPDAFKQNGKIVCAEYELVLDPNSCGCCGGIWADIQSIK